MASISKLSNPSFASYSSSSARLRSSEPKVSVAFHSRSLASRGISASKWSVQRSAGKSSLIGRCSQVDGNGVQTKRTTLHDLYELHGQSPRYDNLCRPVTDLLPLIASGVRGVTSNQTAISSSSAYNDQFRSLVPWRNTYYGRSRG